MTICFLADFRSPIARNWISYFAAGHRVHVLSTQPAPPMDGVELHALTGGGAESRSRRKARFSRWLDPTGRTGQLARHWRDHWMLPAEVLRLTGRVRGWLARIEPDLVHSLRIPIEGQLGGLAGARPHLISAWGNDFTLFADRSWPHRILTRRALESCAGFLADAQIDVERAHSNGLAPAVPTLVIPGAGGVDDAIFFPARPPEPIPGWSGDLAPLANLAPGRRLIVNARGFRTYVRNDTFFAALAEVAAAHPEIHVVGVGLRGWQPVEELVMRLGLASRVLLTGALSQRELAGLHRQAAVMVSPTEHDGTPNTLLETMACGGLPVCGDLPSIREWVDDGVNGLLVPVDRPAPLAAALRRALTDGELAARARRLNPAIVRERATYEPSMAKAAAFYDQVRRRGRSTVPVEINLIRKEAGS